MTGQQNNITDHGSYLKSSRNVNVNVTLYTLQCAGDQVVLAGDKEDLEYMTRKLKETYEKWGFDMNLNKTKYLSIGGTENNLKLDEDNEIEFCQEYKYLGVVHARNRIFVGWFTDC